MRIGVSVQRERLTGTAVSESGRLLTSAAWPLPDLSEAVIEKSLKELLRELVSRVKHDHPGVSGACTAEPPVESMTFDLSDALSTFPADSPSIALRVAPRPPIDEIHELRVRLVAPPAINYVAGGCTTLGEVLVPLDEAAVREIARTSAPAARFVVTAVGAVVNPAQELRVGELLLADTSPSSIDYSHHFPNSSFAVRERTALLNCQLIPPTERLVTALTLGAEQFAPTARLTATTNSGGAVPLHRVTLEPVHSLLSGPPAEFIGAASVLGVTGGHIAVHGPRGIEFAEIVSGVPTAIPQFRGPEGFILATQAADIKPLTEGLHAEFAVTPKLLEAQDRAGASIPGFDASIETDIDLRSLGAALSPLSAWDIGVVQIGSAEDMQRALDAARARAGARLVSYGALASSVRILEARLATTAYEHPRVVSVRVRGIAEQRAASYVSAGEEEFRRPDSPTGGGENAP